ncbi:unnamed protein product [Larinioides sclopetarius]|uniref:Uncharacterized protein n=1 Tax=Larinioides sclopetarius TaxID=280406 RepID=A0AAV2BD66_9ARAC
MAASSDLNIGITRSIFHGTQVHRFMYRFPVCNPLKKQRWTFLENFDTECEALPTSWIYEISFPKMADNRTDASISFTLKRTDSACYSVSVRILPFISNSAGKPIFISSTIERERIHAGEEIESTLTKHFWSSGTRSYSSFKPFLHLVIEVISCHSTGIQQA